MASIAKGNDRLTIFEASQDPCRSKTSEEMQADVSRQFADARPVFYELALFTMCEAN